MALIAPPFLELVEVAAQDREPAPEDIMEAYLYLMGPDSAGVTGQAFKAQRR